MRFPGKWPAKRTSVLDFHHQRIAATDLLRLRGTAKRPQPPRDIQVQSGPRGVFVTWKLPQVFYDIVAWRIYKGDESTLFSELRDRGSRQLLIEVTAGSTPPQNALFISSLNASGKESPKIQVTGAALVEAGAPAMPGVPPGFNKESSGGGDISGRYGKFPPP